MFIDEARLRVAAGRGGDGCISFRREKFVPKGGPDGGDGGRGGDVVLVVGEGLRTLLHLRHRRAFRAGQGRPGEGGQRTGRGGADCDIPVPPGTIVKDAATGAWIGDLVEPDSRLVVARGGRGGKGNEHFKSPTRRSPRFATKGAEGESRELLFELRLLADVGIVGLPNVGKSTLLARVSNARPRIGDYPFTTLEPNLGIVAVGDRFALVLADIPGLVEGAHEGRGLGIGFLKHLGRTRLLLFLLDALSPDPEADLRMLENEISRFQPGFSRRPRLVAFSRCDLRPPGWEPPAIVGEVPLRFSSHTGLGVDALLWALKEKFEQAGDPSAEPAGGEDPAVEALARREIPFAFRIDRGLDLGPTPWPQKAFAGPVDRWGEAPEK